MEQYITAEHLAAFSEAFHASRANLVAMNSVTGNGVNKSALSVEGIRKNVHQYSLRLKN